MENYLQINKAAWEQKVEPHVASEFYNVAEFLEGKNVLNSIELNLLGNVEDKELLHLQCHFGMDSLSLTRMGAKVTGIDIAESAIKKAQELNEEIKGNAQFLCTDLYNSTTIIKQQFDIVFSSYGTIGWLPDIKQWAKVVSTFLKPGGEFIFVEFHPVVWMYDNDFNEVTYHYHNQEPIVEIESGTYADKNAAINTKSITWNHSLAEVINALLAEGLLLQQFHEYDYSPYACLNGMVEVEPGKFVVEKFGNKIPYVYALKCKKPI
jgi:SAM-dependent methyltransferase